MDPAFYRYRQEVESKLKRAFLQEREIKLAAKWVSESIRDKGWIYVSGTGHSHMMAEEIFYRTGGFARVIPVLDPDLMLHISASNSTMVERQEGYAHDLLKSYPLTEKDVFFIFSNSGRNPVTIEMAMYAQEKGARVISITNFIQSKTLDSRHSSEQMLFQVSDLFLDNCGEIGDAAIDIEGVPIKVGPTSTVIGAALIQAIMVQAVENLVEMGVDPEIFKGANDGDTDQPVDSLVEKYKKQVKGL